MSGAAPGASATSRRTSIAEAFARRRAAGQAALVPYVCAGYPDRDASLALLHAAADAGADVLELGIPFSDPLADGPTIQRASFRALEGGMTVRGTLDILRAFRAERDVPVVLFSYLNPVHRFGMEAFAAAAREAGASGLLLTDLPAGTDPDLERAVTDGGLDLIRLLAPTTPPARVPSVARGGSGFLYYIARTGVTGGRTDLREGLAREIAALRRHVTLPIAVGFGIADPSQAATVAGAADGVVVGSALIEVVDEEGVAGGGAFLRSLREAMDAA